MSETRRNILLAGAALGVLAACGPTTPTDNGTGTTGNGTGPSSGGDNTTGGNTTSGGTGGNTTGGDTGPGNTTGNTTGGTTGGGGPRVRYEVSTPQGQQMLEIYARAVGLMMAMPESDPRSWTFQWYTHMVRDDTTKAAEIARIYGASASPQRSLAQQMWSTCQAHGVNEDENFFLPWHRMYVLAFENIVRSVASAPDFTLPYWNYTNPSQRALPSQFRRQGDPTWGPLYRPNRSPGVNAGQPIADASDLSPDVLNEGAYSPLGGDQGFNANLDGGLHGTVHVGVGDGTRGMGAIPWAANDPIFWLHHCNIDRIWASWNAEGNANPSDAAFTGKPFVFASPAGTQISYTVGQVLTTAGLGYSYDVLSGPSGAPLAQNAAPVQVHLAQLVPIGGQHPIPTRAVTPRPIPVLKTAPTVSHVVEGVRLTGQAIHVRLSPAAAAPQAATRALTTLAAPPVRMQKLGATPPQAKSFLEFLSIKPVTTAAPPPPAPPPAPPTIPAPKPGQKVFVVIDKLSTDIQPGVLFQIYLEAPRKGGGLDSYPIGTLNFFSAAHDMPGMPGMSSSTTRHARSFDITDLATKLSAEGRMEANPQLRFAPKGRPATAAQPLIGTISLTIQ